MKLNLQPAFLPSADKHNAEIKCETSFLALILVVVFGVKGKLFSCEVGDYGHVGLGGRSTGGLWVTEGRVTCKIKCV